MRKSNNQQMNEMMSSVMRVAKRIAITILCCIPFLIVLGYLTRNVITNDFLQGLMFVAIMGISVLIVEIVARAREKKKKTNQILDDSPDVFK